jgi:hypothetical protein
MSLVGIELSDAGIIAVGGDAEKLLPVDGRDLESPGFALPEKTGLLVGKAAEKKAHLFPRQIIHNFWDHLNTEPLEQPGNDVPQSTAEIAYNHLESIWRHIRTIGKAVIMAVPAYYKKQQLGLILGITNELSIPVRGFVPLALAASPGAHPGKMMLHLDIHLHRLEVTCVNQEGQLSMQDTKTGTDKALIYLHKKWAEAIAHEFVKSTRFDPLHQAASEQELYDRLPGILFNLQHSPSIAFDMSGGSRTYGITLTRELFIQQAESVYTEMGQLIQELLKKYGKNEAAAMLFLTHRLTRLPGCQEFLSGINGVEIVKLEQGAGARGALEIRHQLSDQIEGEEISFFTSLPLRPHQSVQTQARPPDGPGKPSPTHLLHRSIAYPITHKPLIICSNREGETTDVTITGSTAGIGPKHFTVTLLDGEAILHDLSARGTFVDEKRVTGSIGLKLGQTIRVGTPGEQFQVIASVKPDEK